MPAGPADASKEAISAIVPRASDVMAAIAGLEVEAVSAVQYKFRAKFKQRLSVPAGGSPGMRRHSQSMRHLPATRSDVPATMACGFLESDSTAAGTLDCCCGNALHPTKLPYLLNSKCKRRTRPMLRQMLVTEFRLRLRRKLNFCRLSLQ